MTNNRYPKKYSFGRLHVLNDDIIQPNTGFETHSHRDQEIFTYVLNGELSHFHKDINGNTHSETLTRGATQFISAGKWVQHSELNNNKNKICRILQTWIRPYEKDLPTQYGSKQIDYNDRHNKLYHMISGISDKFNSNNKSAPIQLMQDVNVYVSELDKGHSVEYLLNENRQGYLICAEGKISCNNDDFILDTREAARLYGKVNLKFEAVGENGIIDDKTNESMPSAHIMLIEMKQENEWNNADEPDNSQMGKETMSQHIMFSDK